MHLQKRPVVFGDEQDVLSLVPALLHRVEVPPEGLAVDDSDVFVLVQQFTDSLGPVRRGPVDYHGHPSEMPLHLPQISDERWRVEFAVGT